MTFGRIYESNACWARENNELTNEIKAILDFIQWPCDIVLSLKSTARPVQGSLAGCYCSKVSLTCDSASVISEAYLTCLNEKQKEMPGGKSSYIHLVAGG